MKQAGIIVFGGGLNKHNAIREAETQGYFVVLPFGGNHAELYRYEDMEGEIA